MNKHYELSLIGTPHPLALGHSRRAAYMLVRDLFPSASMTMVRDEPVGSRMLVATVHGVDGDIGSIIRVAEDAS